MSTRIALRGTSTPALPHWLRCLQNHCRAPLETCLRQATTARILRRDAHIGLTDAAATVIATSSAAGFRRGVCRISKAPAPPGPRQTNAALIIITSPRCDAASRLRRRTGLRNRCCLLAEVEPSIGAADRRRDRVAGLEIIGAPAL
jgi:hypothetical protein